MQELTEEQRSKVQTWIDSKTGLIGKCPICSQRQWVLGNHLVQPMPFSRGGGITIGGGSVPLAMLFCNNCGNVQFQSAVMMGLIPRDEEPRND
ncbi:hypothetical protein MOP88_14015 [Sphingomonas sp. WKB10]|nr:hypothetical protein [Sphingomonas sp. WKB10]